MGRMIRSEATRDIPADYAEGCVSMHMCVTLDADANDPASLLAASLVAAQLQKVWGQFTCLPICDPNTSRVRLLLHADFDEVDEGEWSGALSDALEDLWEDDGGCSDYRRAMSLVRDDTLSQLGKWLEEKSDELGMNLALRADVSIHDFRIRQK